MTRIERIYMMEIREVLVGDVDVYRAHRLEMLRESPDAFLTTADEYALRSRELEVKRLEENVASEGAYLIGAFEGETLLGSMGLFQQSRPKRRHLAMVAAVYVTPTARGRGIGGQLLDALLDYAQHRMVGVELLQLGVTSGNTPAIRLYASRGFVRYGVEYKAMKSAEKYIDEDLMMLDLVRMKAEG